jgi:hypothetical protein
MPRKTLNLRRRLKKRRQMRRLKKTKQDKSKTYAHIQTISKVIFYHHHVNGDCFYSRIFVKQIINYFKKINPKIEFIYNSINSLDSHCFDIGIKQENFEKILPGCTSGDPLYSDNTLLLNVWIGLINNTIQQQTCSLCLKSITEHYNFLIKKINNNYNFNIPLIKESCGILPFNYQPYGFGFFKEFINQKKKLFDKIILMININPKTHINFNKGDMDKIIDYYSDKYNNYLFITFFEIDKMKNNIVSIKQIYDLNKIEIPTNFGIVFSYISIFCDIVLGPLSSPTLLCLNEENKNIKDKLYFIKDKEDLGYGAPLCNFTEFEDSCLKKYNWDVKFIFSNNIIDKLDNVL